MSFSPSTLAALVVAASFAAGLNLYATVLTLGLLARARWVTLPPGLEGLASWWILAASALLFGIEFFADKLPGIDLAWNSLHTLVRVPVAALLAYRATEQLPPSLQLLAAGAGAAIALAAHSSKTAARAFVTPSPEPFTNIALSGGEDAAAVGITWLATRHPRTAAAIAAGLTLLAVWTTGRILRRGRVLWRKLSARSGR